LLKTGRKEYNIFLFAVAGGWFVGDNITLTNPVLVIVYTF
jgi:hypothetical protein